MMFVILSNRQYISQDQLSLGSELAFPLNFCLGYAGGILLGLKAAEKCHCLCNGDLEELYREELTSQRALCSAIAPPEGAVFIDFPLQFAATAC